MPLTEDISRRQRLTAMRVSLAVGLGLMALKFLAYSLTASAAILSDALESLVNVTAAALGLWAVWWAARPRDAGHPYGHGKAEYVAAGFEGGLVVLAAGGIFWQGASSLMHRQPPQHLDWGLALTAVALLGNYLLGLWLMRKGRHLHSPTLMADGRHLWVDSLSSVGLMAGLLVLYLTPWWWLDGTLALLLGVWVLAQGVRLVRSSLAALMDESDPALLQELAQALNQARRPEWVDLHNLRAVRYGPTLHIDCHVTLPWYYTLSQGQQCQEALADVIRHALGRSIEVSVHIDPCQPQACPLCALADCPQRKHPYAGQQPWRLENLTPDAPHTSAPLNLKSV